MTMTMDGLVESASTLYVFSEVDGLLCRIVFEIRLAFFCTPFIMSATSWKNKKNAETIQSDL